MAARILVVEDDESMRELLRLHLEHAGYEVAVANDGIVTADYILKPVMVDRLMESVKKALR